MHVLARALASLHAFFICVLVSALSCMHTHELACLPARVLSDSLAHVILQRYAFALIAHTLTLCPHPRLLMQCARAHASRCQPHCTRNMR